MNWQLKSRMIGTIERMPFSASIYYLVQRYVTRTVPRPSSSIDQVVANEARHLCAFRQQTGRELPHLVFEFGAGWDLCGAIVRAGLGVPKQIMGDIHRLASAWQINHVINWLDDHPRMAHPLTTISNVDKHLEATTGISYRASFDARDTGFAEGSVDLIASTNTLEHIPANDIRLILRECHRILATDGVMSMLIDYSDHYSHADGTIGPYNFLQFSAADWRRHDHNNHYQNRLRHCDFRALFKEAGFTILQDDPRLPDHPSIGLPSLDEEFRQYAEKDLLPTAGHFVLSRS